MDLLTGLAILLLLAGTYLLSRRLYVWDAGLLILVSLTWVALRALRDRPRRGVLRMHLQRILPRRLAGWVRAGALALCLGVAVVARRRPLDQDFGGLVLIWIVALAAFVVPATLTLFRDRSLAPKLTAKERWLLVALLLCAGLLRGSQLGHVPVNLSGDEGTQLVAALTLMARPMDNPFATGWYSVPTMSFLAYGVAMRLFGATVAGGRALSAIVGTLTVLTTFLLGRSLGGRRVGWLSAAILAFSAYHIHFSRLASNQIGDPLVGTVVLWLVWSGLQAVPDSQRARGGALPWTLMWGLAGVVAGLGWYAYFGARWVTILVALVFAWRALVTPSFIRRHWQGLLFFGAGWLMAVLPLFGWYSVFPSPLTERVNVVNIFASGWLAREVGITGKPSWVLLLDQAWRAVSAFHLTPDRVFWYFPDRPLLDAITGALLLVGLVEAVLKLRWPSRALCLLWFGSTLVMAWALTESPPSSQRGLLMMPAVAILASWGLLLLASQMVSGSRRRRSAIPVRKVVAVATVLVVVAIAVTNAVFYFGEYTPRRVYGNPTAEIATAFARYTLEHPGPVCPAAGNPAACTGRIYFIGPPRLMWDFGALAFILRDFPGEDVPEGEFPVAHGPARFAYVPERVGELVTARAIHPGGRETELRSPDGRLLMVVYDWEGFE